MNRIVLFLTIISGNGIARFSLLASRGGYTDLGKQSTLECSFDDVVEFCTFVSPEGTEGCQEGYNRDLVGPNCVQDSNLEIEIVDDTCKLHIKKVKKEHFGLWTCKGMYWNNWDEGTLQLDLHKQGELSLNIWGTWIIDMSVSHDVSCDLYLDEPLSDRFGGRIFTWELINPDTGESEDISDRYVLESSDGRDEFTSSMSFKAEKKDNGKMLVCSSSITGQSESVTLSLYSYEAPSSEDTVKQVYEGETADFTISFVAFPQVHSDEVKLTAGELQVFAGNTNGRVSVGEVIYDPSRDLHSVSVHIENIEQSDADLRYTLHIQPHNIQKESLPLEVKVERQTTLADPIVITDDGNSTDAPSVTAVNGTMEGSPVSTGNISLYIIIGVLVICVLLCVLYYCTSCGKDNNKKQQDPELAPKTVEEEKLLSEAEIAVLQTNREAHINGDITRKDPDHEAIAEQASKLRALMEDQGSHVTAESNLSKEQVTEQDDEESKNTNAQSFYMSFDDEAENVSNLKGENLVPKPHSDKRHMLKRSSAIDDGDSEDKESGDEDIAKIIDDFKDSIDASNVRPAESEKLEKLEIVEDDRDKEHQPADTSENIAEAGDQTDSAISSPSIEQKFDPEPITDKIKEIMEEMNAANLAASPTRETSRIDIALPMQLKLESPNQKQKEQDKYSSHFKEVEPVSPPKSGDQHFQEIEMTFNVSPSVKLSQQEEVKNLSSPELVLNSKPEFRPTSEVRVPPRIQSDHRPPKAPRTNPRSKQVAEVQTEKGQPVNGDLQPRLRSRTNSIDAGTQTPKMGTRMLSFESGSEESINSKASTQDVLLEEVRKIKEELKEVKEMIPSSQPVSPQSGNSMDEDQSMFM